MFRGLVQIKRETAEHLRLTPAMHRDVVPPKVKATRTKGAIRLDPIPENRTHDCFKRRLQNGKAIPEQEAEIDTFRTVVKLALVDGKARRLGKWFWQTFFVKKVRQVIFDSSLQCFPADSVTGQRVNLGQCLHHETGMVMVNKI